MYLHQSCYWSRGGPLYTCLKFVCMLGPSLVPWGGYPYKLYPARKPGSSLFNNRMSEARLLITGISGLPTRSWWNSRTTALALLSSAILVLFVSAAMDWSNGHCSPFMLNTVSLSALLSIMYHTMYSIFYLEITSEDRRVRNSITTKHDFDCGDSTLLQLTWTSGRLGWANQALFAIVVRFEQGGNGSKDYVLVY